MCQCVNKIVLVIVNVIFALLGAGLIGVSIWVLTSSDSLFNLVNVVTKDVNVDDATLNNYMTSTSVLAAAAWVLIGFGAVSLLVGICGCIGALCQVNCLLILYSVLVVLIILCEIAAGIALGVFKVQIGNELIPRLKDLEKRHFLPLNVSVAAGQNTSAVISSLVNYAQVSLVCCGVTNQTDITGSATAWTYTKNSMSLGLTVPVTCCPMQNADQLVSRNDWSNYRSYLTDANCPATGSNSIQTGCYDKLYGYVDKYMIPCIAVVVIVGLIEILCVVMACSLIQNNRKNDK